MINTMVWSVTKTTVGLKRVTIMRRLKIVLRVHLYFSEAFYVTLNDRVEALFPTQQLAFQENTSRLTLR